MRCSLRGSTTLEALLGMTPPKQRKLVYRLCKRMACGTALQRIQQTFLGLAPFCRSLDELLLLPIPETMVGVVSPSHFCPGLVSPCCDLQVQRVFLPAVRIKGAGDQASRYP